MGLTFDFTVNEQNQREAEAILFGLKADVATKQPKKMADAVDFLLDGNTIQFLEKMGQSAGVIDLAKSLSTPEKRRLAASLSERFLKSGFNVSGELKTWCLQTASVRVHAMLAEQREPK